MGARAPTMVIDRALVLHRPVALGCAIATACGPAPRGFPNLALPARRRRPALQARGRRSRRQDSTSRRSYSIPPWPFAGPRIGWAATILPQDSTAAGSSATCSRSTRSSAAHGHRAVRRRRRRSRPTTMRAGDLLFFSTTAPGPTHVGIALGPLAPGEFVHAPGTGGAVRIERFDTAYWRARFVGAKRLPTLGCRFTENVKRHQTSFPPAAPASGPSGPG